MIELQGKYNSAKVFTDTLDDGSISQIIKMMNHQAFKNSSVRIMPDCHLGKGSVIGFTASLTDKVIPNVVGVDVGCSISIGKIESKKSWSFETLDKVIRSKIPFGMNTHSDQVKILKNSNSKLGVIFNSIEDSIEKISKKIGIKDDRVKCSIGSLGSGNHFIEIDADSNNEMYLALHSGSRNFGLQVANYHQKKAVEFIERSQGKLDGSAKELAWLEGSDAEEYYNDMKVAQIYASLNRLTMQHIICSEMNWSIDESGYIESIHNYIDFDAKMIRKGAISAQKDEMVVVPISMGDGIIIGRGLGNPDWNFSCAHGAGRIHSRSKAKELLSMDEFKERMNGIWSSCISTSTLDESPMSYKSLDYIVEYVKPTIEVVEIIKPVYNFKAN